ncbi:GGDEF domain-containing protein [Alcanivorax quisquiliarum]|uniref:diguanylate cyclase n=1 Tax=Alcanivorax quisquiliarum TaxID=2933565 RepID=A0ABT0E958_9GAMM|nr:GGDEF domain-containing protein [Alcanivorax quisquiliarum]MCK0538278.1 GGDEF domain-containing protein [Alcanivorax quisquiliarum]
MTRSIEQSGATMMGDLQQAPALALDDHRLALGHVRTALLISMLHTLVAIVYFQGGYMTGGALTLAVLLAGAWAGNLVLAMLVWRRRTLGRQDPTLSLQWNLWLTASVLTTAYFMNEFRLSMAMLFFAAMLLASFRQALPGLLLVSGAGMAGYLLVLILVWQQRGLQMNLTLEMLQWLLFCITAVSFVITGVGINALRSSLTAKNRQLNDALAQAREMAIRDELTGLFNRRHIMELLAQQRALAESGEYRFTVCFVDLDHFKRINDRFGHGSGDRVLRRFAQIAHETLREADYIGRLGGEEFVLVLPQSDAQGAAQVAERLRAALAAEDFSPLDPALSASVSIGIAEYRPGENLKDTLARADHCLYLAKSRGRDRVVAEPVSPEAALTLAPQI